MRERPGCFRACQQKHLMNEAIKRLTSLDVDAAVEQGPKEVERVLNDCVARLRSPSEGGPLKQIDSKATTSITALRATSRACGHSRFSFWH